MLKVSGLFFLTFTLVLVFACVLLWAAGSVLGTVASVERFMQAIGFEDFRFVGMQLLRGFVAAGLVIVVLGTGFSVLVAVVYNLISDLVGGIQLTVLEEDTRARPTTPAPLQAREPASTNGKAVVAQAEVAPATGPREDDHNGSAVAVPATSIDPARAS